MYHRGLNPDLTWEPPKEHRALAPLAINNTPQPAHPHAHSAAQSGSGVWQQRELRGVGARALVLRFSGGAFCGGFSSFQVAPRAEIPGMEKPEFPE